MPAGTVKPHDGLLVRGQRRRQPHEELVQRLGRTLGQHESEALAGSRPDGGEEVGPAVTLIAQAGRSLPSGEPAMADAAFLTELPPAFLDTPLPEEPAMVKLS